MLVTIFSGIILLLVGFVCWILFCPVVLRIDSEKNIYDLFQRGIFRIGLKPSNEHGIKVRLAIMGVPVRLRTSARAKEDQVVRSHPSKRKTRKKRSLRAWRALFGHIVRAIRIERFNVVLDTGNPVTTALLQPIVPIANARGVAVNLNYQGRAEADIAVSVRVYVVVVGILYFLFKK